MPPAQVSTGNRGCRGRGRAPCDCGCWPGGGTGLARRPVHPDGGPRPSRHHHDPLQRHRDSPRHQPCTGAPGTLNGTFKGVVHLTALPDGNSHFTLASVEDISVVLDDPSQPTYTGKTTFTEGSNLNPQNNCTFTNAAYFVLKGTDGSMVSGSRWCTSPCSRTALPPSSSTGFGCTARSGSADPVGRGGLSAPRLADRLVRGGPAR